MIFITHALLKKLLVNEIIHLEGKLKRRACARQHAIQKIIRSRILEFNSQEIPQ